MHGTISRIKGGINMIFLDKEALGFVGLIIISFILIFGIIFIIINGIVDFINDIKNKH